MRAPLKTTAGVYAGDVLRYWHDTGCFGMTPCYARVTKVTEKRLRVVDEQGRTGIKPPGFFDAVLTPAEAAALRAEGINP